ncbi:MAG TPA: low affinity iron permease family protein [Opitutaceae bacterium]
MHGKPSVHLGQHPSWFTRFARATAHHAGKPATFAVAVGLIVAWAISGPFLGFSNTWQLMVNTGTTIVTVLMVFLIQNTQNRDSQAIHLKLDELIRAKKGARNTLLDLDDLSDEELDLLRRNFARLADRARDQSPKRSPALEELEKKA